MAKPITTTPTVKGKDADRIAHEIRRGTPNTPTRERMIRDADRVYARHTKTEDGRALNR